MWYDVIMALAAAVLFSLIAVWWYAREEKKKGDGRSREAEKTVD